MQCLASIDGFENYYFELGYMKENGKTLPTSLLRPAGQGKSWQLRYFMITMSGTPNFQFTMIGIWHERRKKL
jgi:hypothetical protein